MYRIAILDDDVQFLNLLAHSIDLIMKKNGLFLGNDYEIDSFHEPNLMMSHFLQVSYSYQLILLDLRLTKDDRETFTQLLQEHPLSCSLICITDQHDYFFDGLYAHPLWYLIKPIEEAKLEEIILRDFYQNRSETQLSLQSQQDGLFYRDILALESKSHHTKIWLKDSSKDWDGPLSSLMPYLPSWCFAQCHKNIIINLDHVVEIHRDTVLMNNHTSLPVGRGFYKQLLDTYYTYLKR